MARAVQVRPRLALSTRRRLSRSVAHGALGRLTRQYWLAFQRERLPRIALLSLLLLLLASGGLYVVEQQVGQRTIASLGDALWFSIVTMTTVGYGDMVPRTAGGRLIAMILMIVGMGLLSLFTATVASILVTEKIKRGRGLDVIDSVRDHLLVCGWNEHAERVLEGLVKIPGQQVVLINEVPENEMTGITLRYQGAGLSYVYGDPALEAVLDRAKARYAKSAIVLSDSAHRGGTIPPSDERTTLITLAVKSLRANIRVTAEALDMKSEPHLRRAGADDIVINGEFNSFLLSSASTAPGLSAVVRSLLSRFGTGLRPEPIPAGFIGRTFGELSQSLRNSCGFLALAIVTETKGITLDDLLTDDHSLVDQFIKQQFREAGADFLRAEDRGVHVVVNPADSYVIGVCDVAIGIPRVT